MARYLTSNNRFQESDIGQSLSLYFHAVKTDLTVD